MADRAQHLMALGAELRRSSDECARLMASEMGKPVREGCAEIEKCAWLCDYYAGEADRMLEARPIATEARESYACFEPLGVVLAIMPWNFPFWQVVRCAVPALAAGNGVLLKHASNVSGCAALIEQLFERAGLPEGLFANLRLHRDQITELIESDAVAAVSVTGSTAAGRSVAAAAGRALKKCVLELGGSDPYVVLEDADLDLALAACVRSRLINGGQSCIAAKRFVVHRSVAADFTAGMIERMGARTLGNPHDPETDLGPLAREDLRDEVHAQVQKSLLAGATLMLGGVIPERPGAWYPPTVLSNVSPGMPAYDEEVFGPVAAILTAEDEEDAIRIANDTRFGLGAAVFSRDVERAHHIARHRIRAGPCFVNDFVQSDPRLPFGGTRGSGFGRELSDFGIRELVNVKTISVHPSPGQA
jgi:succinate-semialdehyde dehydrogenase/glutarate-semialdehyde dehydrogenase